MEAIFGGGGLRMTGSGRGAMRLGKILFPLRVIGHVAFDRINDAFDSVGLVR